MSETSKVPLIAQPQTDTPNRGYENRSRSDDAASIHVTLEQIDETILNYLTEIINPSITEQDRVIPVPVVYANPERWKSIRKDGMYRDPKNEKLQPPMIVIRRSGMSRNPMTNPNNKYVYVSHQSRWNKLNAYDRFAALNNIVPSEEIYNVVVPDYIDLNYEMIVWTEYMSQMNSIIETLNTENEEFWGLRNQYKFRVKMQDVTDKSDLPSTRERVVRSVYNMIVSVYLIPEKHIKNFAAKSITTKSYTVKKVVITAEIDGTKETL